MMRRWQDGRASDYGEPWATRPRARSERAIERGELVEDIFMTSRLDDYEQAGRKQNNPRFCKAGPFARVKESRAMQQTGAICAVFPQVVLQGLSVPSREKALRGSFSQAWRPRMGCFRFRLRKRMAGARQALAMKSICFGRGLPIQSRPPAAPG